jgi:putative ABC transport system substrate-binding protein
MAHPEGNLTGVANLFGSIGSKWIELLKEAVPRLERAAYIYDPELSPNKPFLSSIIEAASVMAVAIREIPFRNPLELVRGIDEFAADPNGGLIIVPAASVYLETILPVATEHRLPTVCGNSNIAGEGVLIGYGALADELYRRAASFVDRILRGAKVGDLPVEYPTRFRLEVNLKTAKAIGLTISETFLLRADQVIE